MTRLDRTAQSRILRYLRQHAEGVDDPRLVGKSLRGNPAGRWRYRAGDYRIICRLEDDTSTVVVLDVGHRRDIYRR